MTRKEFLAQLGIGAAFAMTSTCLGGCSKDEAPPLADFNEVYDLTEPRFDDLRELGGYVVVDDIVLARTISGGYAAASHQCAHKKEYEVTYDEGEWFCTAHGWRFDEESGVALYGNDPSTILVVLQVDLLSDSRIQVYTTS